MKNSKQKRMTRSQCQFFDNVRFDNEVKSVVRFPTNNGFRSIIVDRSMLFKPRELYTSVVDLGGIIHSEWNDGKPWPKLYRRCKPASFSVCSQNGWHRKQYLASDTCIGKGVPLIHSSMFGKGLQSPIDHDGRTAPRKVSDSLHYSQFRAAVSELCRVSDLACFAVCAAFAGPILRLVDWREGIVFSLIGPSGTGKTTLLVMAGAMRKATDKSSLPQFKDTQRRREEQNFEANDATMIVDELTPETYQEQMNAKVIASNANGGGKGYSQSVQSTLPSLTWLNVVLGAGERHPDYKGGRRRFEGEQRRFMALAVPSRADGGIFNRDTGLGVKQRERYLRRVEEKASKQDGQAFVDLLQFVVPRQPAIELQANAYFAKFIGKAGQGTTLEGLERLAAERFALLAYAGALVQRAGVLDLPKAHLPSAVLREFRRWLEHQRANPTGQSALKVFKDRFKVLLDDSKHLPSVDAVKKSISSQREIWGFRRNEGGQDVIYIDKACRAKAFPELGVDDLKSYAGELGILKRGSPKSVYREVLLPKGYPGYTVRKRKTFLALRSPN